MATERNKWIDAVGKLIALTQERKLLWRPIEPSSILVDQPDKRVDVVYEAEYKDRILRLFREYYKAETFPRDEWVDTASLQLTDTTGLAAWTFPYNIAVEQLWAAVEYQVTGAGNFLDELLAEPV